MTLHLTIANRYGSVEHYYHYLLGFLVPLVRTLYSDPLPGDCDEILVRSCGPLDRITEELDIGVLRTIGRDKHRDCAGEFPDEHRRVVGGFDLPSFYDHRVFQWVSSFLSSQLAPRLRQEEALIGGLYRKRAAKILIVKRAAALPFYLSPLSERLGSGAQRRSIGNHDDLVSAIERGVGNCANVLLERATLVNQIALFRAADVVVAQHGAALANLIWSRPGTRVIEIFPTNLPREASLDFFGTLARCMNLRYDRVSQNGSHGEVDTKQVCKILGSPLHG